MSISLRTWRNPLLLNNAIRYTLDMMETFTLKIVSPSKPLFEGDAEMIVLPGEKGELGILRGHAPLLSTLKKGTLRVKIGKEEKIFDIESGFVEVNEKGVTVLVSVGHI